MARCEASSRLDHEASSALVCSWYSSSLMAGVVVMRCTRASAETPNESADLRYMAWMRVTAYMRYTDVLPLKAKALSKEKS